jgi:DNA-binding MarR family transcriptional regulator
MEAMTLSSGAMTNRIDRLERAGYVERRPDPRDRRGVLISLTAAGRDLVDEAIAARFRDAEKTLQPLTPDERELLATLLRKLLSEYQPAEDHPMPARPRKHVI